jgi:hypothetical protein
MKKLSDSEVIIVEAIYLCIIKKYLPIDLEEELIEYIYNTDPYMYVYLCWLKLRWHVLYAKNLDHLPTKCK